MTSNHPAARILRVLALIVAVIALGGTVWLNATQSGWNQKNPMRTDPADAFINGSIGTELAPLVVFTLLPDLFPDEFHPIDSYLKANGITDQPSAGDWIDQYGLVRRNLALPPAEPESQNPLPVGFSLSYHIPGSGAPSPIPFVGLACAACHSTEIRTEVDKPRKVLYGVGNVSINLLAFSEAVRALMLKRVNPDDPKSAYVLTIDAIEKQKGSPLGFLEKLVVSGWLSGVRADVRNSVAEYQRVIDEPYLADQLADPKFMIAGPLRTQPFRSLVRVHLDRPGWWAGGHQMDQGFSKIPVVYLQAHKFHGKWAQFDGSVSDIKARSTLAASTAGANVNNLALPDIANNITLAALHTETLPAATWESVFPAEGEFKIDRKGESVRRGKDVYQNECYYCHGWPDNSGGWTWTDTTKRKGWFKLTDQSLDALRNKDLSEIVLSRLKPLKDKELQRADLESELARLLSADEKDKFLNLILHHAQELLFDEIIPLEYIGTDPQRVQFRHKQIIPQVVADEFGANFRKDHPLRFEADELRAPDGYLAAPISGTFLRAPYLHNASILTLAELLGLEKRRDRFYRGRNVYDPKWVGWKSPEVKLTPIADGTTPPKPLDRHNYFLFDTKVRGNSNAGHAYPWWAFDKKDSTAPNPARTPEQTQSLKNLLEYLKTI